MKITAPFGNAWVASRRGDIALSSKSSQDAVAALCNEYERYRPGECRWNYRTLIPRVAGSNPAMPSPFGERCVAQPGRAGRSTSPLSPGPIFAPGSTVGHPATPDEMQQECSRDYGQTRPSGWHGQPCRAGSSPARITPVAEGKRPATVALLTRNERNPPGECRRNYNASPIPGSPMRFDSSPCRRPDGKASETMWAGPRVVPYPLSPGARQTARPGRPR